MARIVSLIGRDRSRRRPDVQPHSLKTPPLALAPGRRHLPRMRIGITGATGFLGRHIAAAARAAGHELVGFSRRPRRLAPFAEMRPWLPVHKVDLSGLDALIHLVGESLLGVWTAERKRRIRDSRVTDTCTLATLLRERPDTPRILVSAGGAAFYGSRGDDILAEASGSGDGFLAEVCRAWEAAVSEAGPEVRTVSLRIGIVLGRDGGSAPVLGRLFRLGLGGRLGSGRQWMPWIHVTDAARLFVHALTDPSMRGPVNAVAPGAVTNAEFTRILARTLHRPALFPVPTFLLRLLPGGMHELFLDSQRILPAAAEAAGFRFLHPELPDALRHIYSS